jgi:hypothetical protein
MIACTPGSARAAVASRLAKWRSRLLAWIEDRTDATDAAYFAAHAFVREAAGPTGQLSGTLSRDFLAWYFLGSSYLVELNPGSELATGAAKAEAALGQSILLDPKFAGDVNQTGAYEGSRSSPSSMRGRRAGSASCRSTRRTS